MTCTADILIRDANFAATTVGIEPLTDAGRAWVTQHFGEAAVSAMLTKSGAMAAMVRLTEDGLTYTTR